MNCHCSYLFSDRTYHKSAHFRVVFCSGAKSTCKFYTFGSRNDEMDLSRSESPSPSKRKRSISKGKDKSRISPKKLSTPTITLSQFANTSLANSSPALIVKRKDKSDVLLESSSVSFTFYLTTDRYFAINILRGITTQIVV